MRTNSSFAPLLPHPCYPTVTPLLPHCYPTLVTPLLPHCYPTFVTPLLPHCYPTLGSQCWRRRRGDGDNDARDIFSLAMPIAVGLAACCCDCKEPINASQMRKVVWVSMRRRGRGCGRGRIVSAISLAASLAMQIAVGLAMQIAVDRLSDANRCR
jgi:hypothetical protein